MMKVLMWEFSNNIFLKPSKEIKEREERENEAGHI